MNCPVVILDFGSQYTQLIARQIRALNVYCEVHPFNVNEDRLPKGIKAFILSGGPASVNDPAAPEVPEYVTEYHHVLGICYGLQAMVKKSGGNVGNGAREYGKSVVELNFDELFEGMPEDSTVWMSHGDTVEWCPGFGCIARTKSGEIAAVRHGTDPHWGLQFHPEVIHTENGKTIFQNFLKLAGIASDYTPPRALEDAKEYVRNRVGDGVVICGLSGGVDSTVTAKIIDEVIGKKLYCIYVDSGLMRKNETDEIRESFKGLFSNPVTVVDATRPFLSALRGVSDPEQKRKLIGAVFIETFEKMTHFIKDISGQIDFLAQGTLYPDVIESTSVKGPSATIKSHHNVGGLPEKMSLNLVEPLRNMFKDEVREVGKILKINPKLLDRHPFPGPGLAIRVLGEITGARLESARDADSIVREECRAFGLDKDVWQIFAVLLPVRTVGVMGDERTYQEICSIRAVTSVDGMTADWARLPQEFLARVSTRIVNEVKGINRVVYDITSKPPSTIEYE